MRRLRRDMSDATEKERRDLFVAVVITCLAGLGNGYNIGALDVPALDVNDTIAGVISAAPFAGVTVSALAVVLVLKRGRVLTSIVGETMLVIGIVLSAAAFHPALLIGAQFCAGCGIGFCSVAKPLYVVEKVPAFARTYVLTLWTVTYNLGVLAVIVVRLSCDSWRVQIALGVVPAFAMIALFAFGWADETDIFRELEQKRATEGEIMQTRLLEDVEDGERSTYGASFGIAVLASLFVSVASAVPGYVPIQSNLDRTLDALDIGNVPALSTLLGLAPLIGVAITFVGLERFGKRTIVLLNSALCVACLLLASAFVSVFDVDSVAFASLGVYLVAMSSGPFPLFWVLVPEFFSNETRGTGVALGVMFLHLVQVAVSFTYPVGVDTVGIGALMFMWALVNVGAWVGIYLIVSEGRFPLMAEGASLKGGGGGGAH